MRTWWVALRAIVGRLIGVDIGALAALWWVWSDVEHIGGAAYLPVRLAVQDLVTFKRAKSIALALYTWKLLGRFWTTKQMHAFGLNQLWVDVVVKCLNVSTTRMVNRLQAFGFWRLLPTLQYSEHVCVAVVVFGYCQRQGGGQLDLNQLGSASCGLLGDGDYSI